MIGKNSAALTVIIADDCVDIRLMLTIMLEIRGYRVLEAENGQVAVELARCHHPDLILMDLDMPILDGYTAACRIRQLDDVRHVPIIAVSASPKESHMPYALTAGCNDYISKPVDFKELDHLLSNLLAA